MNLPNKLTLLRVLLVPVFMAVLYLGFPGASWVALVIFIVASLTDLLDGKIARKYNLVTDFGKFADPLADKMLTTAAFLAFLGTGHLDVWAVMIVLTREFMVTSVRLLAAKDGTVIAANIWGKLKTVAQFVAILFELAALEFASWQQSFLSSFNLPDVVFRAPLAVGYAFLWISVVLTAVSGLQYVWGHRQYFKTEK